ncbi:hypothetical protein MO973_23320 [Paenibacillus sp. TRM 82003]|nr:hypothetical protein [Paenibacillus sp. TRM 82003]
MIRSYERPDQPIYVLLTDTGTRFTKIIKRFRSAPYNHASIALDSTLTEIYSFGRKRPTNPFFAGFIEENVYEGTYRHFPDTRCALLRLNVSKRQRVEIVRTLERFRRQKDDYRYNLFGLLGVLLDREWAPRNAYFCSQFVAEVLRSGIDRLWSRPSALVTPNCMLKHPAFEIVYEGCLYDYPLLDPLRAQPARPSATAAVGYRINGQAG